MELTPTPAFTSGALELLIQTEMANVQNERSPCLTRLLEESIVARGLPFEPIRTAGGTRAQVENVRSIPMKCLVTGRIET